MKTLTKQVSQNFREKGSKFIGYIFTCDSEGVFNHKLDEVKAKYPDASHHCYAWRINPNNLKEYSSDDGEPSGTAGLPILNQLKSFDVVNVGAVVVRYFGGTKLGKSGLIEAYGLAAKLCLENAALFDIVPVQIFEIRYPYPEENFINQLKNNYDFSILESEYLESVKLKVACPKQKAEAFEKELTNAEHLGIDFEKQDVSFLGKG